MIIPVGHWQLIVIVCWITIVPVIEVILYLAISLDALLRSSIQFIIVFLHLLLVIGFLDVLLFKAHTRFS